MRRLENCSTLLERESSRDVESLTELVRDLNSSDSDNDSAVIGGTIGSGLVASETLDFEVVSFFLVLLVCAGIISSKN